MALTLQLAFVEIIFCIHNDKLYLLKSYIACICWNLMKVICLMMITRARYKVALTLMGPGDISLTYKRNGLV